MQMQEMSLHKRTELVVEEDCMFPNTLEPLVSSERE